MKVYPGSLGIASFGPVCLDKSSEQYGNITTTPKVVWQNFPIYRLFRDAFGFDDKYPGRSEKLLMDTDVNIPALYEYNLARARNDPLVKESLCYITVGTGIGIGLIINGKTVHGMMHPEGGHVRVPISPLEKTLYNDYKGTCPFHGDCLEGLCNNIAIKERLGLKSVDEVKDIGDDNQIWDLIAYYMGTFCANLFLTMSVERISIGGGIYNRQVLMKKTREVFE